MFKSMKKKELKAKLKLVPKTPGIYKMKNSSGDIIYIGKSNNLKQRIASYFQPHSQVFSKVRKIVKNTCDFDYIITSNEIEALILECNLIKEYLPKYNVKFKDGRGYPYIKIPVNDDFPRLIITRKLLNDGARYFGPYTKGLKSYLRLFKSLFPLRTCRGNVRPDPEKRTCINYHIKRCKGVCIGEIRKEEYKRIVKEGCSFLEGKHSGILKNLKKKINLCIKNLHFEKASVLRDQFFALEKYSEKQKIVFSSVEEEGDFIGTAVGESLASAEIYFLREGRLRGHERFLLDISEETEKKEILSAFIQQFYFKSTNIPRLIYLEEDFKNNLLTDWLSSKKGSKVKFIIPKKGKKKDLITMANNNAREYLKRYILENKKEKERARKALLELKDTLSLPSLPVKIEAFDISNISGKDATGSMIVFHHGTAKKSLYRRYKIKSISTPDDYSMMKEVIERRYKKILENNNEGAPDLILIDGGKGQLNITLNVLKDLNLDLPVISLAKEKEIVFSPGNMEGTKLIENSESFYLIQKIRDEAHRFAVSYHRKLRRKRTIESFLDGISGIGEKRKQNLLNHFGSIKNLKKASIEEINNVKGMNQKVSQLLYENLKSNE